MIITSKNFKVLYWGKKDHVYKHLENKSMGYKLEVGQRLQAIRYDLSNKYCNFAVTVEKIDDVGITVSKIGEGSEIYEWAMFIDNWKGEPELNNLVIEPLDHLYKPVDLLNYVGEEGIYNTHSGYSGYHDNIKNFVKLGQIEMDMGVEG